MKPPARHRRTRAIQLIEGGHGPRPHEVPIPQIRQVLVLAEGDTTRGCYKRIARKTDLTVDQVVRILRNGTGVRGALHGWRR